MASAGELPQHGDSPADPRSRQHAKSSRTRSAILDAAAAVTRSEGVSGLTLERVAEHAEVSKGGLLYHFANKGQLLVALLENTLARTDDDLEGLAASNGRATGSFAKAYLDYVRSDNEAHLDSAAGIFAAAALDDGDLTPAQSMFEKWQNRLLETDGLDPTLALLVRVVGDGLWLIDLFGLAAPSDTQRADLCDLVEQLLDR